MWQNIPCRSLAILLCLFQALTTVDTSAQSKVQGSVLDLNGVPLANVSVLLLTVKDSSLVKGLVTTRAGKYAFEKIAPGQYLIASSFTGYKTRYSPAFRVETKGDDVTLDDVKLIDKETNLKEVTVSARLPLFEQKIDRMVINVASSIVSTGSTALDVLMRSPGIIVDQQNNTISMNGKDGVVVMINGKINRMPISAVVQMLAGMNASNIERIELITTPPANFEAEGNAGFINIVMKTNTQYGTNGSYSATLGYGKGWLTAASINLNHRRRNINLYGDLSFTRTEINQIISFYRMVGAPGKVVESFLFNDRDAVIRNFNGRIGVDYSLGKKTILGALISGFHNRWSMQAVNRSNILLNGTLDTIITINIGELHALYNYGGNLNLLHNFKSDEKLTLNVDYIYYKDRNPTEYQNIFNNSSGIFLYEDRTKSSKLTPIRFYVASADYAKKLSKEVDMEVGLKATLSKFNNDVSVEKTVQSNWMTDKSLTARYSLQESIGAAYASFNVKVNEKTSGKLGVRYEYTDSNLGSEEVKNIVDRHYGRLFPSLFLSRRINEKNSINASYSRRITRPTFNDMAPFVFFVDPNTFFSGNPALQPSISNGVKLDYLLKSFVFSAAYTYEAGPITNFAPRVDPVTNKQTFAAENQKNRKVINVSITLPVTVNHWWSMQNNISGTSQQLNAWYKGSPLRVAQKNLSINSVQTVTLPKDYAIELRGYYQSGGLFGIYRLNSFAMVDFGLQKKLAAKKGSFRFAITNLIGPPHFKPYVNIPDQNIIVSGNLQFVNTLFKLTYTRNFGNEKLAARVNRQGASDEERQRVNTN